MLKVAARLSIVCLSIKVKFLRFALFCIVSEIVKNQPLILVGFKSGLVNANCGVLMLSSFFRPRVSKGTVVSPCILIAGSSVRLWQNQTL